MKAKIKIKIKMKTFRKCEIPGCDQKAVCGTYPKGKMSKTIHICKRHRDKEDDPKDSFSLWEIWKEPKPLPKRKLSTIPTRKKSSPRPEGKPAWQKILDGWFAKGKYPVSKFMNSKRWDYWISIGGEKPQGESRKFAKKRKAIDDLLDEANKDLTKIVGSTVLKGKVRRKK